MAWARLDDAFYTHRKVIDVSPAARWLFVAGLCYCNQNLTDGEISTSAALSIGMIPSPKRAIGELVRAGLWIRHEGGGYQVHDYLQYQLSREQILKAREAAAERQARRRRGSSGQYGSREDPEPPPDDVTEPVSHGVTSDVTDDVTSPDVTTTPYPYPPPSSGSHHQTTSSCGEPDKPDDDEQQPTGRQERALAACDLLGDWAYEAAEAAGKVKTSTGGYRRSCRQSAHADHLGAAQTLAHDQPEMTPAQIAAFLGAAFVPHGYDDPAESTAGSLYQAADERRLERATEGPLEQDRTTNLTGIAAARAARQAAEASA